MLVSSDWFRRWARSQTNDRKESYLVNPKEPQVPHDRQSTDSGAGGDFPSHLQADLDDFQRICEDHLGTACLKRKKEKYYQSRVMANGSGRGEWSSSMELWIFYPQETTLYILVPSMKTVSDDEFESKYSNCRGGLGFEPCDGGWLPFEESLSLWGEGSGHCRPYLLHVKVEGKRRPET